MVDGYKQSGSWHQPLQCHHPETGHGTAGRSRTLRLEEPDSSHALNGVNMQTQDFLFSKTKQGEAKWEFPNYPALRFLKALLYFGKHGFFTTGFFF